MDLRNSEGKAGSLFPLYLSVFVAVLGFSLVAPIFPLYAIGLGASYTLLGFIISVYGAVQLITQIPIGRLSDRRGRKPLIILGLLAFTVLPPLYIYATNAYLLIPIRILGGIGASAVWPLAMAMIIDKVGSESRGAAMGRYNAAFYSAVAVGSTPFTGGTDGETVQRCLLFCSGSRSVNRRLPVRSLRPEGPLLLLGGSGPGFDDHSCDQSQRTF
jgi:MFS family permease